MHVIYWQTCHNLILIKLYFYQLFSNNVHIIGVTCNFIKMLSFVDSVHEALLPLVTVTMPVKLSQLPCWMWSFQLYPEDSKYSKRNIEFLENRGSRDYHSMHVIVTFTVSFVGGVSWMKKMLKPGPNEQALQCPHSSHERRTYWGTTMSLYSRVSEYIMKF